MKLITTFKLKAPLLGRFFLCFLIFLSSIATAQSLQNNSKCLDKNFKLLDDEFTNAINLAKWSNQFSLQNRHTLVINIEKYLFIYSTKQIDVEDIKLDLGSAVEQLNLCHQIYSNNSSEKFQYKLIFYALKPLEPRQVNQFKFIHPPSNREEAMSGIEMLAKKYGPILFIKAPKVSNFQIEEVQRTIIHEGMHLFGQKGLFFLEPHVIQSNLSSRDYLQEISTHSQSFKSQLSNEICLSLDVINASIIIEPLSKIQILENLNKLLDSNRARKYFFGINNIENYWIILEGIPEFLDHQILVNKSPERLASIYQEACDYPESRDKYFYPNLIGAAIFHGLNATSESDWQEKIDFNSETILNLSEILKNLYLNNKLRDPGTVKKPEDSRLIFLNDTQIETPLSKKIKIENTSPALSRNTKSASKKQKF